MLRVLQRPIKMISIVINAEESLKLPIWWTFYEESTLAFSLRFLWRILHFSSLDGHLIQFRWKGKSNLNWYTMTSKSFWGRKNIDSSKYKIYYKSTHSTIIFPQSLQLPSSSSSCVDQQLPPFAPRKGISCLSFWRLGGAKKKFQLLILCLVYHIFKSTWLNNNNHLHKFVHNFNRLLYDMEIT